MLGGFLMPKTNNPEQTTFRFSGFQPLNSTPVPDAVFDELLTVLTGAELKALLYIIRRTFGFKKDSDNISLSQMLNGIRTKDGRILDKGAGLSKPTLLQALRSLQEKHLIETERQRSAEKGDEPTLYRLKFADTSPGQNTIDPVVKKVDQGGGKKTTPGPWSENLTTQETVLQETVKQEIYPSNIRRAKSDEFDLGSSNGSTVETTAAAPSTQNDGVGYNQTHNTTNVQNVEKIEEKKTNAPAQNQSAPARTHTEPQRKGGLSHIGETLQTRLLVTRADNAEARGAIESYIRDIAVKLHDEAPLKNSTTRAYNLYQRSGVHLGLFFNILYDAEKEANRRSATIKKLTAQGFKNRMAYFFAIVEDKLGLREQQPLPDTAQRL
jgi:hypothetical protein